MIVHRGQQRRDVVECAQLGGTLSALSQETTQLECGSGFSLDFGCDLGA